MFILKSKYLELGISEEWLNYVSVDKNGYIQHPPDAVIGEDGVTTLASLVLERLGTKEQTDEWFNNNSVADYVWEPINNEI